MDFMLILEYLVELVPALANILAILGAVVTVGTVVDTLLPEEKQGFMSKFYDIPVLGDILKAVKRFSPFNIEKKKED